MTRAYDTFFIPIEPIAKGRPRKGAHGNFYTPRETRDAEEAIRLFLRGNGVRTPLVGEVVVRVTFHVSHRRKLDLDNALKLLLDACNNVLWEDDQQVIEIHAWMKRGAERPGIELTVYHAEA